ncbi:class III signal peptide-containing protein [Thermococcus zilligii]|uniref:class III signal peptide-containing protein n=1 Tax=Thermococcus zilligii TaxID=54076 RepID=UPI00029B324B|nr:class III signal peptide-containing protein [Thermococcus zilligii]
MGRKGQVSLEFLFVFAIMVLLLAYSINNVTFKEGSTSVENLRIQVALEEKSLANAISNTINQVYAQGPGAKATGYVRVNYLRDPQMLEKATGVKSPKVFITYENGPLITITGTGSTVVLAGPDKNAFWSESMYKKILSSSSSIWSPKGSVKVDSKTAYGLEINPSDLPPTLRIVVEWNPDAPEGWKFNSTTEEIRINIKPGG